METEVWIWFHTALDHQLSMIESNRRTNYDHGMASSLCVKGIFKVPDINRA
jgi:hypothetical protein